MNDAEGVFKSVLLFLVCCSFSKLFSLYNPICLFKFYFILCFDFVPCSVGFYPNKIFVHSDVIFYNFTALGTILFNSLKTLFTPGERWGSTSFLLGYPNFSGPVIGRQYFPQTCTSAFVKNPYAVGMWVYIRVLLSVSLFCLPVFRLIRGCVAYLGFGVYLEN